MIDNLERALGALERHAPAEDEVLAGLRAGIIRRRRRRQIATVAGTAVVVGALALGAVYLAPSRGADQSGFVAPATPKPTPKPAPPPSLPFSAGWMPDGYRLDAWQAGPAEGEAQYVGTKDFQTVVVWISAAPRDRAPGDTEELTTIAGRPGMIRRLEPDRKETQLIWQLADGRWAMVGGRAPTVPLATLRQVADHLVIKPTPVTPVPFTLIALPDGYGSVRWGGGGVGAPMRGSATMCRSAFEPGVATLPADCVSVTVGDGTAPTELQLKQAGHAEPVAVPIDQARTVAGVLTRATADGKTVVAQIDAGHWAEATSQGAGADLLRQVVVSVRS